MLLDKVTSALDPETSKAVLVTIPELAEGGMTGILVTHQMGFAGEVGDHIHFTDQIVEHGSPATFSKDATPSFGNEVLRWDRVPVVTAWWRLQIGVISAGS